MFKLYTFLLITVAVTVPCYASDHKNHDCSESTTPVNRFNHIKTYNNYGNTIVNFTEPELIDSMLKNVPLDWPIIDLGCGYGACSESLHQHNYQSIYSIDLDPKNFADNQIKYPAINFVEGNFPDEDVLAKLPENNWGAVLAINILHFMDEDRINSVLNILSNRLRSGGFLIVQFYTKSFFTSDPKYICVNETKFFRNLICAGYALCLFRYEDNGESVKAILKR